MKIPFSECGPVLSVDMQKLIIDHLNLDLESPESKVEINNFVESLRSMATAIETKYK